MGEVIAGRFELVEHIASGGSGSVWRAWDRDRTAWCAAKVMRQSYSADLLRFVREQGVKFDHPHLLTPYGWAAVDERVVIATELMAGGNLAGALRDHGGLGTPLVAEIVTQVLEGLRHVHDAGWVHRDVKPANVLLEATGEAVPHARLADFGIAVHADEPRLTELGGVVGTPGFMAPELGDPASGADVEPEQDLYAVGAMALQLLNPGLRGPELANRCRAVAAGADPGLELHGPLADVVTGLLAFEPPARRDAADAAGDLLRPLRRTDGYAAASGEPFEVFEQFDLDVTHLSERGATGEPGPAAAWYAVAAPESVAPPPTVPQDAGLPTAAPPAPQATAEDPAAAGPPGVPGEAPAAATETASPAVEAPPAGGRTPALLIGAGILLALVLGGLSLWLIFGERDGGGAAPGTSAPPSASDTAPGTPGTPGTPEPAESPTPTSGPTTAPAETSAPRTSAAPSTLDLGIRSNVEAGDDCTVLEAGLRVEGADGQGLTCRYDDGAHRWTAD
ncbi:hypothetical protein BJH93_02700 [Kocuria polaris]|nr:hypothetical protein [Kocuria polaris]